MSETTAEERAAWLEEFPERVTPYNTRPLGQILAYADARRLIADVDRLEKERDSWKEQMQEWMEGSAQLQVKLDSAVTALRARSKRVHHLQKHQYGLATRTNWEKCGTEPCINDRTFLDGLSTVTDDYAAHLRERALNAGKTAEEMRKKYGLPPRCERVSVRPHTPGDETDHICAYHGGTWPVEGKCPAAELEDIAALGDGRDEYGSVQP